jgi:hypothetical protein
MTFVGQRQVGKTVMNIAQRLEDLEARAEVACLAVRTDRAPLRLAAPPELTRVTANAYAGRSHAVKLGAEHDERDAGPVSCCSLFNTLKFAPANVWVPQTVKGGADYLQKSVVALVYNSSSEDVFSFPESEAAALVAARSRLSESDSLAFVLRNPQFKQ